MTKAGILALCLCAAPRLVAAQTMQWTDNGYVTVNGGFQLGSHDLNTNSSGPLYGETATLSSTQKVTSGGFFEIGGAYRVWGRNILGGISYSHTTSDADVAITGSIPDPLVFDSPRSITAQQTGAKHTENVVHLDLIWMLPVANKTDVALFAGPTILSVKQGTIITGDSLTVTEPVPIVSAPLTEVTNTSLGFNLGADLQYMVNKRVGVGGIMRYTWGSADIEGATDNLTVGGFQIGVGARVRF